jgi:L-rhamnose-H+ transport protein
MITALYGVLFHWIGGLASGSFYVPYKGVKNWSWETYWLTGGFFSWIICPWAAGYFMTSDLFGVLTSQENSTLLWTYFFGVMWGLGGLTFGLSMRYLGLSLGMGVALGYTAAFGTLLPPIFKIWIGKIPVEEDIIAIASSSSGLVTLTGVAVCLLGIAIAAMAGFTKEKQMPEEEKKKAIAEFSFKKGIIVATFSGIMSACFAFALTAGKPIATASANAGTETLWTGLPILPVILAGGFTTNFIWCVYLSLKNKSGYEYLASHQRNHPHGPEDETIIENVTDAPAEEVTRQAEIGTPVLGKRIPLLPNYLFSALAGTCWYLQFFFYTMGETQMGKYGFASWTLHMASIIIFSTMWGFIFKEWKGASGKARGLIIGGIATLVLSTIIIGIGTWMKGSGGGH